MAKKEKKAKGAGNKKRFRMRYLLGGFVSILLTLVVILSPGTYFFGLAYVVIFPFGWMGMFLLSVYFIFLGFCFIFHRHFWPNQVNIVLPYILMVLGGMMLATHLGTGGSESMSGVGNYLSTFQEAAVNDLGKDLTRTPLLSGGIVGFLLDSLIIENVGLWLLYVVAISLIVIGFIWLMMPLTVYIVHTSAKSREEKRKVKKAERERAMKEAALNEMVSEKEKEMTPFIAPEDIDNSFFEGNEEAEAWNSPLEKFRFTPAGSNPVPSSSEISRNRNNPYPVYNDGPNAPKELPSGSVNMDTPLTTIGLQEAVFTPQAAEEAKSRRAAIEAETLPSADADAYEKLKAAQSKETATKIAAEKEKPIPSFSSSYSSASIPSSAPALEGLREPVFGGTREESPFGSNRLGENIAAQTETVEKSEPAQETKEKQEKENVFEDYSSLVSPLPNLEERKEERPAPSPSSYSPSQPSPSFSRTFVREEKPVYASENPVYPSENPANPSPIYKETPNPVPSPKPSEPMPSPSFSRSMPSNSGYERGEESKPTPTPFRQAEPVPEPVRPMDPLPSSPTRSQTFESTRSEAPSMAMDKPTPSEKPASNPMPAPTPRPVSPRPTPTVPPAFESRPAQSRVAPEQSQPAVTPNVEVKEEGGKEKFFMPKAKPLPAYEAPSDSLLEVYEEKVDMARIEGVCCQRAAAIDKKFADLRIGAHVAGYTVGPSVTRFDIETDPNVSVTSITRYMKDISKAMGGVSTRFTEIVPGKTTSAIEVVNSNEDRRLIPFSQCLAGLPSGKKNNLAIPFGIDIENKVVWGDLSKFPHMLVAGTTGSGKSIFIQGILMSLVMRNRPEEVKLMLVDPKRVEFSKYRDIPHLLCRIIKEAKEAKVALKKLCDEMDHRYSLFENAGVSEIREFNSDYCEPNGLEKLPFIILVIDEYADLVEQEKDVGSSVMRLSAKARACGIHLIICTQRPDVKVINGTIKNNLSTRVALHLKTATDSITILNQAGAEELLDHGDMLVDCDKISREFVRVQGCMVGNHEITRVTNHVRAQMPVSYSPIFNDFTDPEDKEKAASEGGGGSGDPGVNLKEGSFEVVYEYVRDEIMKMDSTSISRIQRQFRVGYPRASEIMNKLVEDGIVAAKTDAPNSSKPSEVLIHSLEELNGEEPPEKGAGSYSSSFTTPADPYEDDE